jgi:hypothetical protein
MAMARARPVDTPSFPKVQQGPGTTQSGVDAFLHISTPTAAPPGGSSEAKGSLEDGK